MNAYRYPQLKPDRHWYVSACVRTLQRIAAEDFDRLYPGHRTVIEEPTTRANDIIDHHRERTTRIVEVLQQHGPADAWTVSAQLFGSLEGIHILHGPGEAFAHLDHLERLDIVRETAAGYQLSDEDPDLPEIG
jgi:hypothetical protein